MPTDSRRIRTFDRSSLSAYIGAGAAIAFIAAMTFGAIDSPSERGHWVAGTGTSEATHLVSAAPLDEDPRIR